VTTRSRLESDRAELARFVDATFRCGDDDPTAAVLWPLIKRLGDDPERWL
jgi:hypothetical protein